MELIDKEEAIRLILKELLDAKDTVDGGGKFLFAIEMVGYQKAIDVIKGMIPIEVRNE